MPQTDVTTPDQYPTTDVSWWSETPEEACARMRVDGADGLGAAEAARRRSVHGANSIPSPPAPSTWSVLLRQLADPMNIMLIAVVVVSVVIGQFAVALLVAALVGASVVLGTRQELGARASVDALANLQIPQARVIRDGSVALVPAPDIVPGDIVQLEAGDMVPADGRIVRAASLETQEAALTGESAPVPKSAATIDDPDPELGDRANILFQNTTVTRGTATMVVTDTGMTTQMGRIAAMLQAVEPSPSPLQRELNGLTKVLGFVAWGAVAVMIVIGLVRGETLATLLLIGISMAVSAIPAALPTFVQGMLAYGARLLADRRAVVKNLTDVETLGATSAINSDKTGTLTLNAMTATRLYAFEHWYTVEGEGYDKRGTLRHVAGAEVPDFTPLAYVLCLNSDATVSDAGAVVGDPTEAALVVLAAKLGVDAEESRREYPREAEVPFDSAHKFMVTCHHAPLDEHPTFLATMKGAPDIVIDRCTSAYGDRGPVPIAALRESIDAANAEMSGRGLRVLAVAIREIPGLETEAAADPMSIAEDFTFVALIGIIDPLRPEAIEAVRVASEAGIEVRMITGDHADTAAAIGRDLGLKPGAISGAELRALDDAELSARLPALHVFGRVTPEDKLRVTRLLQERGDVVAMTGDAVNDAAALKQADIGVAMGSGSEVTKQAGRMILTDDDFGTLVAAVDIGRAVYDKIATFLRYQMSTMLALVLLFLVSSIVGVNGGVPLTPLMVLYVSMFVLAFPTAALTFDPPPEGLMSQPPRDKSTGLAHPGAVIQWAVYGVALFAAPFAALLLAPGQASSTEPSVPMTMTFAVLSLGSIGAGLAMRRDPDSGLSRPVVPALKWLWVPVVVTVLSVEVDFLQAFLMTTALTGPQWWAVLGLALVPGLVVELDKLIRRRASVR
ncbi:cation-translocating P-type ATPase [Microbacter sp. GSS18]|nr:cation-translocating P-type ATPase [Microbacter sp. GSS18]